MLTNGFESVKVKFALTKQQILSLKNLKKLLTKQKRCDNLNKLSQRAVTKNGRKRQDVP